MTDKDFQRIFTLERRRAERSRRPFLLLLLDMGECIPCEKNGKVLEKILVALSGSTRGTDVTGWYRNNSVLGVMFTEVGFKDPNTLMSTLTTRVGDTLRKNLSEQQFDQTCISFHSFPEEWNHDIPANPDAPVYSPLKPKPNRRSGGAMAIPEPDESAGLATRSFRQPMIVVTRPLHSESLFRAF